MGISNVVSAMAIVIVVLIATVGFVSYQSVSNSSQPKETTTLTQTVVANTTQPQTSVSTTTVKASNNSAYAKQAIPANFPKTCLTNYPAGFNLNASTYFIIANFTMNFAQVCVKYTYYPQNDTRLTTNGKFNASFSGSMYITDSFGNASQGGSYPYDAVYASPQNVQFNSTGDSVIVVYDFQWSFIFSNFIPSYAACFTPLLGIGIAQTNGDGSSGINSNCGSLVGNPLSALLVGTSYLKPAVG